MKKKGKEIDRVEEFLARSDAEKAAVVAEFDKELIDDTARPLTPEMRRLWERAKRKQPRKPRGRTG